MKKYANTFAGETKKCMKIYMEPETPFNMIHLDDLHAIEGYCWQLISEAASNRKIAMHQPVVATAIDGMAHMRTVVLRRADADRKAVYFHTDNRSLKLEDIHQTGKLSWLFYDQHVSMQIRLSGPTIIHHKDDLAFQHWQKTGHHSRRCYIQKLAPSTITENPSSGFDEELADFQYSFEESEKGFEHFTVIETNTTWLEWFYVHHDGNRRARFTYENGSIVSAAWLIP